MKKSRKAKRIKRPSIKIDSRPLTETQIKEFVKFYEKHGVFPGSKIPCTVTGKLTTCMGPWMLKKIKEFGSPEGLLRNYKCRGALKSERVSKKPAKLRKRREKKAVLKQNESGEYTVPTFTELKYVPITERDIVETTKTQCLRPDIFLHNCRNCEGCPFFKNCSLHLKCLPKGVAFDGEKFVDSGASKKKK